MANNNKNDIKGLEFNRSHCVCYGCEDRKVGCHGSCQKYRWWAYSWRKFKMERQRKELELAEK